jgi:hypothetical protein
MITRYIDKMRYRLAGLIEMNARNLAAWIRFAGK